MTEKKGDKVVSEAVATVKKVADKLAEIEKGAPPAPAETKPKDTEIKIGGEFGSTMSNRRLRKAVEDTVKIGGKATPVEKVKGPTVVIAGMNIAPIVTGLKATGSSGDVYVHDGKEFWLPGHLLYNAHTRSGENPNEPWIQTTSYKSPEMSLFAFVYDNVTFYLLMDEHSSFSRDAECYYPRTPGGHLIMINSTSHNDHFINSVVLANVESSNNTLNQSHIIVNSSRIGPQRGWGGSSPFKVGDSRQKYSDLRLKKTDVIDSSLTRGQYYSCNFTNSCVTGTNTYENHIKNTYLTECRIRGSRVKLKNLTGEALDFNAEGEVLVKGVGRLNNHQWHFPSIHVTNRFAFTEIDYVTRHDHGIKMVRTTETEVEIALQRWKEGIKVAIDAPRHTVELAIRDGLKEGKEKKLEPAQFSGGFGSFPYQPLGSLSYRGEKPGDGIRNYMDSYIVDQVVSRLGMIQMLDEVEKTAKELNYGRNDDDMSFLD